MPPHFWGMLRRPLPARHKRHRAQPGTPGPQRHRPGELRRRSVSALPHVVVVGDGFGGLFATRRLARGPVTVTLLGDTGVHLFQVLRY